MSKAFKILYLANLAILIIGLLLPIGNLLAGHSPEMLTLEYWAFLQALALTFCVPFLGLNTYAAVRDRLHRRRYTVVAITVATWIIWGAYQFIYAWTHDIVV